MPFTISPKIQDIPVPKQDVFWHIWGETSRDGLEHARGLLRSFGARVDVPDDLEDALKPGGIRISNIEWGDMPSGFPHTLARVGLNMAWITAPVGFEPRGTYMTHAGMNIYLNVRSNPVRDDCDLARSLRGYCPEESRISTALIRIARQLGASETMSAHEAIQRENHALYAASRARSVDDLEAALKMVKT